MVSDNAIECKIDRTGVSINTQNVVNLLGYDQEKPDSHVRENPWRGMYWI